MLALVASIHVWNTALEEDVGGRDKPDHDAQSERPRDKKRAGVPKEPALKV